MKSKGIKIDYNRVFLPMSDMAEFESLCPDEVSSHDHAREEKTNGEAHLAMRKKHEIVIPLIKKLDESVPADVPVLRLLNGKKIRRTLEYIRFSKADNLPRPDLYESSDKDVALVDEINARLAGKSKSANGHRLTVAAFESFIRDLEMQTDRYEPATLEYAKSVAEKKFEGHLQEFIEEIYNHWRGARQLMKRPLLRLFWKSNIPDDTNPRVAFRPREKEKMKLRRSNKGSESSTLKKMQHLRQDSEQLKALIEAIKLREKIKSEQVELNFLKFEAMRLEKQDHLVNDPLIREIQDRHGKFIHLMKKYEARNKKYVASKEEPVPPQTELNGVRTVPKPFKNGIPTTQLTEDFNFALAGMLSTMVIEATQRNLKPEFFKEIIAIAGARPKPEQKAIQEEPPVERERRLPTPVLASVPSLPGETTRKGEKESAKPQRKLVDIFLRRRVGRNGLTFIDRCLRKRKRLFSEIDTAPYIGRVYDYKKNPMFETRKLLPNDMIEKEKSSGEREILRQRNEKFEDLLCPSDQEDDFNDVIRSLRKIIKARK